jgi:CheY-like chemotaxis protein
MDLHMPRMDGFEATRRIRKLPGRRGQTPIIVLTADCRDEARAAALAAGAEGYLQKPIEIAPLVALADALVRNFRTDVLRLGPPRRRRAA